MHLPYKPQTLFSEPLFTKTIPSLEVLRHFSLDCLREDIFTNYWAFEPIIKWFAANSEFAAQLERLSLPQYAGGALELGWLVEWVAFPHLQSLELNLKGVDAQFIEKMERKLPGLKELSIVAEHFGGIPKARLAETSGQVCCLSVN